MDNTENPTIGSNTSAKAILVDNLRRLWGTDAGAYWKAFHQSGLEAKDVWPDAVEDVKLVPDFDKPPSLKKKG